MNRYKHVIDTAFEHQSISRYNRIITRPSPERRSKELEVIEDVIPLFDVNLFVLAPQEIRATVLVPDGASLDLRHEGPYLLFQVPRIDGHAMVSLAFA